MWTRFMDMHSGGDQKEPFAHLLVEAPEAEAKVVFYNLFGHNPDRVTCTCCGPDYSIDEHHSIEEATAYDRGLRFAMDARGSAARSEPDYKDGLYLEPGQKVPEGMTVSGIGNLRNADQVSMDEFLSNLDRHGYKIIRATEISDRDRRGEVPDQGYVWVE